MTNLEALKILQRVQRKFLQMDHALDISDLENKEMAVSPVVAAVILQFDTATDKIAARIQKLVDKIAAGTPLSADDQAALQSEVDKLNLLGQDPENPVPPTVA
jgi:hypothetical protein